MSRPQLALTLVSGFVGAGKSTLVARLAVPGKVETVRLGSLEETLMAIAGHANDGKLERLLVELTGVAEPLALVEALLSEELAPLLDDRIRIDGIVTVVDAENFLEDFASGDDLDDRDVAIDEEDDRALALLVADQIECATTLVIAKGDKVDAEQLKDVATLLNVLNPSATIFNASDVTLNNLTDSAASDPSAFGEMAAWAQALDDDGLANAFVYRARKPLHPARFWEILHNPSEGWQNVVRSKGAFWLASRHDFAGEWSQAGGSGTTSLAGAWFASVDASKLSAEERAHVQPFWQMPWGDRRQELVFLGVDLDRASLKKSLDAALLTDAEMKLGPEGWLSLEDPFPSWEEEHDHEGHIHGEHCNH